MFKTLPEGWREFLKNYRVKRKIPAKVFAKTIPLKVPVYTKLEMNYRLPTEKELKVLLLWAEKTGIFKSLYERDRLKPKKKIKLRIRTLDDLRAIFLRNSAN